MPGIILHPSGLSKRGGGKGGKCFIGEARGMRSSPLHPSDGDGVGVDKASGGTGMINS